MLVPRRVSLVANFSMNGTGEMPLLLSSLVEDFRGGAAHLLGVHRDGAELREYLLGDGGVVERDEAYRSGTLMPASCSARSAPMASESLAMKNACGRSRGWSLMACFISR